jgi:hypothetical protein
MLGLRDAIASTALSHPDDCSCLTCKAASGDKEAFTEILIQIETATEGSKH